MAMRPSSFKFPEVTAKVAALVIFASLSALVACSQGDPASPGTHLGDVSDAGSSQDASPSCPSDLPSSCPDAGVPSYAGEVKGIIEHRCFPCHAPGGVAVNRFDFSQYNGPKGIHQNSGDMLSNVYACIMPPSTALAPTPDERKALLTWLVCQAPNN